MRRWRRAFTLIEVIMASIILFLGFLTVAGVFSASYRGSTNSQNHNLAVQVAQNVLAQERALPFGATATPSPTTLNDEVEGIPTQVTFTPTVGVSLQGGGEEQATVTVTWREGTNDGGVGTDKSYVLQGGVSREP